MKIVNKAIPLLLAGSLITFSSGCSDLPISKEIQGTLGGAVVGAAVGAKADGKHGAIIGGLIGGFIGNRIGSYLDEEDKKKLQQLEMKALETDESQSFIANKSKEEVTITPGPTTRETLATYELSPNVTNYSLDLVSRVEIAAHVDTPIYSDTNRSLNPRMVLKKGQQLVVPATVVDNSDWGAVAEGDTVIGYVPLSYLDKHTARAYAPPVARAKTTPRKETAKAPTQAPPSASPAAPAPPPAESTVQASAPPAEKPAVQKAAVIGNCKISVRRVKNTTENIKYCKEPPSGWKVVKT
ncbi:MAG: glycine zipper 2TM domain-containing protein [Zoogloeaceae bacterium]|jgi:hypothetical protein|nr:glycine zipper 2TM domain-containing protein [Zoogloeaceae bacterium]